jgi:hypothetical protein
LEALGWNEVGFNFHSTHDLIDSVVEFKRGLVHFRGTIAWKSISTDDSVVLASLVNELIYQRASDVVSSNVSLHRRLIKLMRATGMVEEKRALLTSLGMTLSDATMATMLAQRKSEHSMFQYGIRVESEAWSEIVKKAWEVSSVVVDLEKWGQSLTGHQ